MGKRKLTETQRKKGVLYQRQYRAAKRDDLEWRKRESERTKVSRFSNYFHRFLYA
jgi:hypothetical protein